jgi:hypothetical protein
MTFVVTQTLEAAMAAESKGDRAQA